MFQVKWPSKVVEMTSSLDSKKLIVLKEKSGLTSPGDEAAPIATFGFDQMEDAYAMATLLEQQGVEVELFIPGAVESLASELQIPADALIELHDSIKQEIDDHD